MTVDFSKNGDSFERNRDVLSVLKYGRKPDGPIDISFVIPTYKRPRYLREAIDSVYFQKSSWLKYEILIVDNEQIDLNASEKGELLRQYPETQIAYYQNEKNIGMFANWNRCIELAKGNWVAMLHDDDLVDSDFLRKVEQFYDYITTEKDIAYIKASYDLFGDKYVGKNSEHNRIRKKTLIPYRKIDIELLMIFSPLGAPSCGTLINKELCIQAGGYREILFPSGDTYFPTHLVLDCGCRVFQTREIMGHRRIEDNASLGGTAILEHGMMNKTYYTEYYPTIGKIARMIYALFRDELLYLLYVSEDQAIEMSDVIEDKCSLRKRTFANLGQPSQRLGRLFFLKGIEKCYRILKGL